MKKSIGNWISPLFIMGTLLMLNNCKKEVTKNDPIITWANPADITYGTLLSASQLNATSDAPGTFTYTPAIGSKLNVGANQDLKVDFTPNNATNYNTATKTVKINVFTPITVTDADGNVYNTITIGTQTWMIENLRTTKYNDGTPIPNVTDGTAWYALSTPAYCCYNNDAIANKATYGALYNWYAVNYGKLAPKGCHVPTDAEWTTLENYLIDNGYNYDGTTTGDASSLNNKIAKALASATGWKSSSIPGSVGNTDYPTKQNATGFTALPSAYRNYDGTFENIGYSASWWCSSSDAWTRGMQNSYSYVYKLFLNKNSGMSVRCIKDNKDNNEYPINGKWGIVRIEHKEYLNGNGQLQGYMDEDFNATDSNWFVIEFKFDNTFYQTYPNMTTQSFNLSGSYSVKGDTLSLIESEKYDYSYSGGDLTLRLLSTSVNAFTTITTNYIYVRK